jgi:hypothetical protein
MYFYHTDKIVLALQYDLYTDQYNNNQTGWLITLYKMGPGQAMMLYTSSTTTKKNELHVHIITI